jgi:hypothetical protein
MKRIIRILIGTLMCPLPLIFGTCVWIFSFDDETWLEGPGQLTWWIASGQWEKLPD